MKEIEAERGEGEAVGSRWWSSAAVGGWQNPSHLGSPDGAAATSEKERGGRPLEMGGWDDGEAVGGL